MSTTSVSESIIHWLSRVDSHTSPTSLQPSTPSTASKSPCTSRKRRQSHNNERDTDVIKPHKRQSTRQQLSRPAVNEVIGNTMNPTVSPSPSPSPTKSGRKLLDAPSTPQTTKSAHSSNPSTSSFPKKQTPNNDNVRASLAEQGMYFEDEEAFEKRPELQKYVVELVMGSRGSKMRDESAKEIKFYMAENATKDEKTLFGDLVPMIVKKARGSEPTLKRDVAGEIKTQAETFWATDNLDKRTDCQFLKNALPRRIQSTGTTLGLSEPKPDWVYGLKRPLRPELTLPTVSEAAKALIEVAPGLQHAWFAVENKGAEDSIESAETQAIRSGAALVSAQRQLAILAGLLDPAAESIGADQERFAFTCSWVPQLAKIHVHWHEKRANEVSIYHMNLIRGYLMIDKTHLSDFRKDIHNVLDYGVSRTRKEKLMELTVAIAKVEAERSPKKQVGEGSTTNESAGS